MGLEPTTSAVTGRRSNQLSHRAIQLLYLQNRIQSIPFFIFHFHPIQNLLVKPSTY